MKKQCFCPLSKPTEGYWLSSLLAAPGGKGHRGEVRWAAAAPQDGRVEEQVNLWGWYGFSEGEHYQGSMASALDSLRKLQFPFPRPGLVLLQWLTACCHQLLSRRLLSYSGKRRVWVSELGQWSVAPCACWFVSHLAPCTGCVLAFKLWSLFLWGPKILMCGGEGEDRFYFFACLIFCAFISKVSS